jgi:hypothetical protein
MITKTCPVCNAAFHPPKSKYIYCSLGCAVSARPKRPVNPVGKWHLNIQRVTVKQHRKIASEHAGCPLLPHEDVHHIKGDKTDNRIENLMIVPHGEHTRITNSERTYTRGKKIVITEDDRARRRERIAAAGRASKGTRKSEEVRKRMSEAQKLRRANERGLDQALAVLEAWSVIK